MNRRQRLAFAFVSFALLVLFTIGVTRIVMDPLRKSPEQITTSFRQLTPLGTSYDEAAKLLSEKGLNPELSPQVGFLFQERGVSAVKGISSIRALLGEYKSGILSITSVSVYFGFDVNGLLTEIWVRKTSDSL